MKQFPVLIFVFLTLTACPQSRNAIWCFGDSAGIDFNNWNNPVPISSAMDGRGSCVSIADTVGNLLFYAQTGRGTAFHTGQIYDRTNQIMQNGNDIVGDGWYNEMMIIPFPDSSELYYLIATDVTLTTRLTYSIINMTGNAGLGTITQKNIPIDHNSYYYDAMAAVKHGNGRDWWLITKQDNHINLPTNYFEIYLIKPDGILHMSQVIGGYTHGNLSNMTFSKDGAKFLFTTINGLIEVLDFDRCSGQFSNPYILHVEGTPYPRFCGSSFSPNGNIIYVSTNADTSFLLQFDLTAINPWASQDTIAVTIYPMQAGGAMRLAPDNKIYWSCAYYDGVTYNYPYNDTERNIYNENLSVVNDPDSLGSACNFTAYSFFLGGKRTYWGLPNNPDYDMGPLVGSTCDTLSVGINKAEIGNRLLVVYPNPFSIKISLNFKNFPPLEMVRVRVINLMGETIVEKQINTSSQELDLRFLPYGVYLLTAETKEGNISKKLVKLH